MRLPHTLSLRGRLILLLMTAFASLGILASLHLVRDAEVQIKSATTELVVNARLIAARQAALVERADAILNGLLLPNEQTQIQSKPDCMSFLAARLRREPDFTQIMQAGANGDAVCAATPFAGGLNIADRPYFQRTLHAHEMILADVVIGRILKGPVIIFGKATRDADDRATGAIFLMLGLNWLERELAKTQLPDRSRLAVVDGQGAIAARYPDPEAWTGKTTDQIPVVQQALAAGGTGAAQGIDLAGEHRLFAYTPLFTTFSGSRYTLWLSVPQHVVEAPAWRDALIGLGTLVAVLSGTIALVIAATNRLLLRPLIMLSHTATRLKAGEFEARSGLPYSKTEIGELAETLDQTAAAIEERECRVTDTTARLADANANLERRVAERTQQLEHAYNQIQELDAVKSRFFANVSHELRTPLTLILGPADELLASAMPPMDWRKDIGVIRRNAQTLLSYVNDLLDLSRFDAGQVRLEHSETDLAAMVRFVADHFSSRSARRSPALVITAPQNLPVQADHGKIVRVLFNLVSNAFKYVPADSGRVEITLQVEGDHAAIEVSDNGPGVAMEMREKIFERFVQAGSPKDDTGSGLGLAIAKEFIGLHGGGVVVKDAPGGAGALFRATLPLVAPLATSVGPADHCGDHFLLPERGSVLEVMDSDTDTSSAADKQPLVLVVEDNEDVRAFIGRALRSIARVAEAADGQEGLAAAERLRPDIILTDIMMPRMNGDEMIGELRSRTDLVDTPVMVLSARADEPLRIRLLRGQAQDFLVKPFATDELQARVANLLSIKRARDILRAEVRAGQGSLEELAHEVAALNRRLRLSTDEMRVARDRAEQASRAKSAFLDMVSHELRTPLTQLELQLELHRRLFRGSFSEKQHEVLSGLDAALNRLSRLVDSVLQHSRAESGRMVIQAASFDVTRLVAEACADVEQEAERRGLKLAFGADATVPALVSDRALVGLIVSNLLDNAVKYTPQGKISARVTAADGFISIEISDTGVGIPAEFQSRIYEPFEHLEEVDRKHVPGVGLGLALVKEITELLGGHIRLDTAVGKGSTFTLELPLLIRNI